jgi:leader peptidase (prepilin peptidase)/N-methyltransferase
MQTPLFFYIFYVITISILGACIGSFLNVCIYRIPLRQSIIYPGSHCPNCKEKIHFLNMVPVLSFLLVKKCKSCNFSIPKQYFWIEFICFTITPVITIPLFLNLFYPSFYSKEVIYDTVKILLFFYSGLALSVIDLKHRILPNKMILTTLFLIIFIDIFFQKSLISLSVGVLVGFFLLFSISSIYKLIRKQDGMGFGDVKYLALIGGFLGWKNTILCLFISSFIGSFIGIIYGIKTKQGLQTTLPFGPFLYLSGLFILVLSQYFSFFSIK